jgi:hypothetical protein
MSSHREKKQLFMIPHQSVDLRYAGDGFLMGPAFEHLDRVRPSVDQVSKKHEPPRQFFVHIQTTESIEERVQYIRTAVQVADGENDFSVGIDVGRTPFRYVYSDGFLHY